MKYLSFTLLAILISLCSFGLTPITGPTAVCVGSSTTLFNSAGGGTWSSSNPTVASVGLTSGVCTGVAAGTTTISYKLGITTVTAVMTVNTLPAPIAGADSICVGSTTTLSSATGGGIWSSSITAIATIAGTTGIVTPVGGGYDPITYTIPSGCRVSKILKVNPLPAPILTGVGFVFTGNTLTLSDITATGHWSSSNLSLATVGSNNGVVTGISSGILRMSYTMPTGCYTIAQIEVNPFPRSADLDAWYPFCADTTDHSGMGHDLLNHITTPGVLTSDRFTNLNTAYRFNGVSSKMQLNAPFPLGGTNGDFTYSCWINPLFLQNSIIMYNGDPSNNGWGFVMNDGNLPGAPGKVVSVRFYSTALGASTLPVSYTIPTLSCWYQLILVKQGATYSFYVGSWGPCLPVNPPTFVGSFVAASYPFPAAFDIFSIGNYTGANGFSGSIDDIAIYHEALSTAERYSLWSFNPDARPFTLGPDVTICEDSITIAPTPQDVVTGYLWSNGNTVDTAITIFPSSAAAGSSVWLKMSKPFGCVARDTITVHKAPIPINLGIDTNICTGDTITLNGGFPGSSFQWGNGSTAHSIRVWETGIYTVRVDSGVCVGRDSIKVHKSHVPIVDLGPDTTHCNGVPITVRPSIIDLTNSFKWSNFFTTPTQTFAASGTFTLTVTDSGCSRSDDINVYVVFDTLHFYPRDTAICFGQYVGTNVQGDYHITYQWTPTAGIAFSTSHNPDIRPDTSAEYIMTAHYPGCPDIKDSFFLDVQPVPKVYLGGNKAVCRYDTLHITPSVQPTWFTHYIYSWTPGTFVDDTTLSTIVFSPGDSTHMVLTVTTSAGCKGVDSSEIIVYASHLDSFLASHDLCPGDSVQLQVYMYDSVANVPMARRWTPGLYIDDSMAIAPWIHPITSHDYRMIGTTSHGCADTLYMKIVMHPAAVIYLGDSVTLHPGDSAQISPQTNCTKFGWYPPLGLNDTSISNPVAKPDVSTMYIVHASTENGCVTTDSINIHVDPETLLDMPNAFVPGGFNKTFNVVKHGFASLNYFRIYDRWGLKVFETTDINKGWDGNYSGKPQPFGVYTYEILAVTSTGKLFKKHGNVTLIR